MAFCRNCGQQMPTSGPGCERCGYRLEFVSVPVDLPTCSGHPPRARRKWLRVVGIVIFIGLAAVSAGILALVRSQESVMVDVSKDPREAVWNLVGPKMKFDTDWFQMMKVLSDSRLSLQSLSTQLSDNHPGTVNRRLDELVTILRGNAETVRSEPKYNCSTSFIDTAEKDASSVSDLAEILAGHPTIAEEDENAANEALKQIVAGSAEIAETRNAKLNNWLNQMRDGYGKLRKAHAVLLKIVPANGSVSGSD